MRIVVTGASGLLGLNLCLEWRSHHDVVGIAGSNLLNVDAVPFISANLASFDPDAVLTPLAPDAVVHCAALTDVDRCEDDPDLARMVNAEAPGEVARWCARNDVAMVYVSSDAVFDGRDGSYRESDRPNPVNAYGRSKLAGEEAVLSAKSDAFIARLNLFGWSRSGHRSLVEFFLNNLKNSAPSNGFLDVRFSPILANEIAYLLNPSRIQHLSGVWHVASRDVISKYAFGREVATTFGYDENLIRPVSSESIPRRASRPRDTSLDGAAFESEVGQSMPTVREGLHRLKELDDGGFLKILRKIGTRTDMPAHGMFGLIDQDD